MCYVTDRRSLAGDPHAAKEQLLAKIEMVAKAGVGWIQVREKDLSGRELETLAEAAVRRAVGVSVLMNDRLDVALASGAAGVHLGENSLPVEEAKRLAAARQESGSILVGVSTHSLQAALAAEHGGADYAIFGPVFATPSKGKFGSPQGLASLKAVCGRVAIPVLAIGGITLENARACVEAGAAGIAAIRLFQDAADVVSLAEQLRAELEGK